MENVHLKVTTDTATLYNLYGYLLGIEKFIHKSFNY